MQNSREKPKFTDRLILTPRIPHGLAFVVESLTREVIRNRPKNIYVFAAHHFEKLMKLREDRDNCDCDIFQDSKTNFGFPDDPQEKIHTNRSNWTMNDTIEILEHHRSIFGEKGQKLSNEELKNMSTKSPQVRVIKKEKRGCRTSKDESTEDSTHISTSKYDKYATRINEETHIISSTTKYSKIKGDYCRNPKLPSQISPVKSVNSEFKKKRTSSVSYDKSAFGKTAVKSKDYYSTIKNFSEEKNISNYSDSNDSLNLNSSKNDNACNRQKMFGSDYSVEHFSGDLSLKDLQTRHYVEKVQEVIDETTIIIKQKVESLKKSLSEDIKFTRGKNGEEISTTILRTKRSKLNDDKKDQHSDSQVDKLENRKLPQTTSPIRNQPESVSDQIINNTDDMENSQISLPIVRSTSSKSASRSISRSESDSLILPPITPESTKSSAIKPVGSILASRLSPTSADFEIKPENNSKLKTKVDEIFHDSLDITPEPNDDVRLDSLEPVQIENKDIDRNRLSGGELKRKLIEIENMQKKVENIFDSRHITQDEEENKLNIENNNSMQLPITIQEQLMVVKEVGERIEAAMDLPKKNEEKELGISEVIEKNVFNNLRRHQDIWSTQNELGIDQKSLDNSLEMTSSRVDGLQKDYYQLESLPSSSYILSEGSPNEIPESVTTVIIPERKTPESDISHEIENKHFLYSPEYDKENLSRNSLNISSTIDDVFGEIIEPISIDISDEDNAYISNIKTQELLNSRNDLTEIKEESNKSEKKTLPNDSEDDKILKVVKASLEEILEESNIQYVEEREFNPCIKKLNEIELVSPTTPLQKLIPESSLHNDVNIFTEIENRAFDSTDQNMSGTMEKFDSKMKSTDDTISAISNPSLSSPILTKNLESLPTSEPFPRTEHDEKSVRDDSVKNGKVLSLNIFSENEKLILSGDPTSSTPILSYEKVNEFVANDENYLRNEDILNPEASDINVIEDKKTDISDLVSLNQDPKLINSQYSEDSVNQIIIEPENITPNQKITAHTPESGIKELEKTSEILKYLSLELQTESSTFISAITEIQAGIRGFLTRRRLKNCKYGSSTLDSVSSLQESFVVESLNGGKNILKSEKLLEVADFQGDFRNNFESRARKRLHREDAMQKETLSMENAFTENHIQHTGEFHDCLPLPVLNSKGLENCFIPGQEHQRVPQTNINDTISSVPSHEMINVIPMLPLMSQLFDNADVMNNSNVHIVVIPDEGKRIQSNYLNFITSLEDIKPDMDQIVPSSPKDKQVNSLDIIGPLASSEPSTGVIIEDVTNSDS